MGPYLQGDSAANAVLMEPQNSGAVCQLDDSRARPLKAVRRRQVRTTVMKKPRHHRGAGVFDVAWISVKSERF